MKNKIQKSKVLTRDLVKYSEQIGLTAIPRITFSPKEWDKVCNNKRRTKRDRWLGCSSRKDNAILVNLEYAGPVQSVEYRGRKNKRYQVIKNVKWNMKEARHTLIHELVHIRWKMSHGYEFWKRIEQIENGRIFPPIEIK